MLEKNSSIQLNKNSTIRRERRTKVFFVWIVFVMALLAGAVGFLRKSEFQISDVNIVGTRATDANQIADAAGKFMSGHYALVIPKTNALIFSKMAMRRHILDAFPGIDDAHADFSERNVLTISVMEKQPALVWCNALCWFADQRGVIYDEAPEFSDGVFMKFEGMALDAQLGADPRRGRFASTAQFEQIQGIITALQTYPASVVGVKYLNDEQLFESQRTGPGDIAIRIDSIKESLVNPNAVILITQDATVETVIQSFDLVMNEGKFADTLRTNGKVLQYVDLRFDGKIYYKFAK